MTPYFSIDISSDRPLLNAATVAIAVSAADAAQLAMTVIMAAVVAMAFTQDDSGSLLLAGGQCCIRG